MAKLRIKNGDWVMYKGQLGVFVCINEVGDADYAQVDLCDEQGLWKETIQVSPTSLGVAAEDDIPVNRRQRPPVDEQ